MMNAGLRRCVDRAHLERDLAEVRTDVDNPPAALRDHDARRRLAGEEYALQRCGHRLIELFFGDIERERRAGPARVIDEYVEAAKRIFRLLDQRSHLRNIGDISRHNDYSSPECLDLTFDLVDGVVLAIRMLA